MVTLYLHIGCEKTGSTSIQRFLKSNRERLRRNGILFPRCFGEENQKALTAVAQMQIGAMRRKVFQLRSPAAVDEFRQQMKADLGTELDNGGYDTALVSGEHCSSRLINDEEVRWLRDFLGAFFDKIYVVVYLRRQDEFLLSSYSAEVKAGGLKTIRLPDDELAARRYDYWELLSRWSRAFGRQNMICRKFESCSLKNGDVVDDYLAAIRLKDADAYERPRRLNQSLDATSLEFLRLFNAHIPRLTEDGLSEIRGNIVSLLAENSSGPLLALPPEELRRFMGQFAESNRQVALEYFGGIAENSDDPLFAHSKDVRPRTSYVPLTAEAAVEIAASIWRLKQLQIQDREAKRLGGGREQRKGRRRRFQEVGNSIRPELF